MDTRRDLIKAQSQDESKLIQLRDTYQTIPRIKKILLMGEAVDLSNRIARLEGKLRVRQENQNRAS